MTRKLAEVKESATGDAAPDPLSPETPVGPRRGRPPGSRNKSKQAPDPTPPAVAPEVLDALVDESLGSLFDAPIIANKWAPLSETERLQLVGTGKPVCIKWFGAVLESAYALEVIFLAVVLRVYGSRYLAIPPPADAIPASSGDGDIRNGENVLQS